MRKQQQRQILDLLETIKQAQSAGLYADCQEGALFLCDFIESIDGIDSERKEEAVALLVQYCELLFKANNGEIRERALQKHFIKIENNVKNKLKPNRIEIAFISYMAAMSDALESIYLAAKADPACDAYFIPVPYYNRNTDSSLGEMCYEGADCYSDHIEITNWQTYNIEERQPDAIFTFAAYDDQNTMTCIHPDFFCERLRNLTDMLIYIPYFVTDNDIAEHHMTLACVYAHKVIVQSEKVRESYIRYYKKEFTPEVGNSFGKPEDKFIALGSPKFDAAINSKKEDFRLPEEWQRIIGEKKVIFYNSSVVPILQGDEQYLEKLNHIFNTFRNRQDVSLWWRPHPLNKEAYQTMRPHLLDKYMQIITRYRKEGWGIYDDTADLHRAIAWTDAYYGDVSSVAALYLSRGKPSMISNIEILSDELPFFPACMYVTDEHAWLIVRNFIGFVKMNKMDFSTEWMGGFPVEKDYKIKYNEPLYFRPVESDSILYFPPFLAREIALYSLDEGEIEIVPYENQNGNANNNYVDGAFRNAVVYKNSVFFTPYFHPALMKMDITTKEISFYTDYLDLLKKSTDVKNPVLHSSFTIVGSLLWFVSRDTNKLVSFDMDTCTSAVYEVGKNEFRYFGICFDGENFWLSPHSSTNTPVVKWNPKQGVIKEFPEIYEFDDSQVYPSDDNRHSWQRPIYADGYIWLLPICARHAVKIEACTNIMSIADEFESDYLGMQTNPYAWKFRFVEQYESKLYVYKEKCGTLVEYDFSIKSSREEVIQYPPETIEELKLAVQDLFLITTDDKDFTKRFYYETEIVHIDDFISYILSDKNNAAAQDCRKSLMQEAIKNADGTAGKKIYAYLKNNVLR